MKSKIFSRSTKLLSLAAALVLLMACQGPEPGTFASPEEAVQAVADLIGSGDEKKTNEIFGPGSADLFKSGDETADRQDGEKVKAMILAKVAFEDLDEDTRVVYLGEKDWPFPIPLVRATDGQRWRFDTAAGREELLNRRIGRNELFTIASLHALVDAQREYRSEARDGNPPAYAKKFSSSEGRRDGLFWPVAEGEPLSPLGDLFAGAEDNSQPGRAFHGYHYRTLTSQGKNAPGGEKNYLDAQGLLTGGFAAVAWPAKYGNSGVMTFIVNQQGIVFQKDLGAETSTIAAAIWTFDPDRNWDPTPGMPDEVEIE